MALNILINYAYIPLPYIEYGFRFLYHYIKEKSILKIHIKYHIDTKKVYMEALKLDIKQLKYFYTIVEEGQITSAAKRLHMAQPPLSYQLKALEEELGTKLLERGSRKIQLTEAGQLLYNRAEQILELTESTLRELKDFNAGFEGTLSLGTVTSSGSSLLLERINKFHNTYGGIKFEIYEGNSFRILDMLNTGLIEIGIVRTPLNLEDMNAVYLPKEPMVAAMTESIDWDKNSTIISIVELFNQPLIIYRRFEKLFTECFEKYNLAPTFFCKNDDARTTLLWAEAGLGVAIVPKSAVKLIDSTNLILKEIKEPTLSTQIAAVWLKNKALSEAAKNFLQIFEKF